MIHKRSKVGRGHEFVPVGSVQKKKSENANRKCKVHKSETIKFICETCDPKVLCCATCMIDDGHQKNHHDLSSVEKYASRQKDDTLVKCNELEELLNVQKDISADIDIRVEIHQSNLEFCRSRLNDNRELQEIAGS